MIECSPLVFGRVAQWQSIGLLSRWLRVRISPRSSKSSRLGGFLVASPHSGDGIRIFAKHPAGSALTSILPTGRIFGCESPFRGWYSNLCEAPCGLRAHLNPPNREDFWLRVPIQGMVFESLRSTLRAPRSSKSSFAGGFFAAPAYQSDFSITLINTSTTSGSK